MDLNWKSLDQSDSNYLCRSGHSLTYLRESHCLLLFGGSLKLNDILLYSIDDNIWLPQNIQGRKPPARCFHAHTFHQDQQALYVYGGEAEKGRSLQDLHVLFTSTWTWKKVFLQDLPLARHGHTMVLSSEGKVVFGGTNEPSHQLLDDTWKLTGSLKSTNQPQLHGLNFERVQTKGTQPKGRKYHSAFVFKNQMFVVGGHTLQQSPLSVYGLSLITNAWRKVQISGSLKQRSNFSLVMSKSQIIIFGGIQDQTFSLMDDLLMLDLPTFSLIKHQSKKSVCGRCNHAMVVSSLSSPSSPFLAWLVGGTTSQESPAFYQLSSQKDTSTLPFEQQLEQLQREIQVSQQQYRQLAQQLKEQSETQDEQNKAQEEQSTAVQHILTMIKSEQFVSQQLHKKEGILKSLWKCIQEYIYQLDGNYKNYGEERQQIEVMKSNHINTCVTLKRMYTEIERLTRRNLSKIQEMRSEVVTRNREFQGFMETEVDEDM